MRERDHVAPVRILLRIRALRVVEPRVDVDPLAAAAVEAEGGMSQPGEGRVSHRSPCSTECAGTGASLAMPLRGRVGSARASDLTNSLGYAAVELSSRVGRKGTSGTGAKLPRCFVMYCRQGSSSQPCCPTLPA